MSIPKDNNINISNKRALIIIILLFVVLGLGATFFVSNNESYTTTPEDNNIFVEQEPIKEVEKTIDKPSPPEVVEEKTKEVIPEKETDNIVQVPPPIQVKIPEQTTSFEEINQSARKALVNILCTTKTGGSLNPLSGSGVIVDDRGIILTNAHVAQYYLLLNYSTKDFITCTIRMGSPSKPLYKAKLMYISDRWVKNNSENIIKDNYSESGEHDYALLLITGPVSDSIVFPNKFDFVKLADENVDIKINDNVVIAGYPAGFLGGATIQKDLYVSTTIEQIKDIFTFKKNTLDLISLGGSILAQKGSSGGAVVNSRGELIAIPVTSTNSDQTDERDLRAITTSHIDRSLAEETGEGIKEMLSYDPKTIVELFDTNKFEELKSFLVKALER